MTAVQYILSTFKNNEPSGLKSVLQCASYTGNITMYLYEAKGDRHTYITLSAVVPCLHTHAAVVASVHEGITSLVVCMCV